MAKTTTTTKTLKFKGWKVGQKCIVNWKGMREGIWKGFKGGCSFVDFDNGDGTGFRCHRVFSSLVLESETKVVGKVKKMPFKAKPEAKKSAKATKSVADDKDAKIEALMKQMAEMEKQLVALMSK